MEANKLQQVSAPCESGMVSIIMPVYNVEAYLEAALKSLCAQTYTDWECICVDDGSKDRSPDIVHTFAERDPRFRLILQENQGPGAARNNALQHVRGEFLLFVDSDDLVAPDLLETCVARLREDDSDVCIYGHAEFGGDRPMEDYLPKFSLMPVQEDGGHVSLTPQEAGGRLFTYVGAYPWNRMYRTSLAKKADLSFLTHIRYAEDDYFVLLAMAAARRISFVRKALYFYRKMRQGNQTTSLMGEKACTCFLEASRHVWAGLKERGLLNLYGEDEIQRMLFYAPDYLEDLPTWASLKKHRHTVEQMYAEKCAELAGLATPPGAEAMLRLQGEFAAFHRSARKASLKILLRNTGLDRLVIGLYRGLKSMLGRK